MPQIKLPKSIAQYTGGKTMIDIPAENLLDALKTLTQTYELGTALLKEDGSIQPYIGIVLGDQLLNKATLAQPQSIDVSSTPIQIKTAFAGG